MIYIIQPYNGGEGEGEASSIRLLTKGRGNSGLGSITHGGMMVSRDNEHRNTQKDQYLSWAS